MMDNKKIKIAYYVATGLFSAMLGAGALFYVAAYDEVATEFTKLGFPLWIIYPLAIAKLLGVAALWQNKSTSLKEWAYSAFFFELLLATGAHVGAADGEAPTMAMPIGLLLVSYFLYKRLQKA